MAGLVVKKLSESIYHFIFDEQQDMTRAFIRFSEITECDEFYHRPFTVEQYQELYCRESWGKIPNGWDYYDVVLGFNIPGEVFTPSILSMLHPLHWREQEVVRRLVGPATRMFTGGDRFYVIATFGESNFTVDHEIAHALWYVDKVYRGLQRRLVQKMPDPGPLNDWLIRRGYSERVLEDERHAFLAVAPEELRERGLTIEPWSETATELAANFADTRRRHGC